MIGGLSYFGQAEIFFGTIYYQRLRHMVSDKFQVRTNMGPVDRKHEQPVKACTTGCHGISGSCVRDAGTQEDGRHPVRRDGARLAARARRGNGAAGPSDAQLGRKRGCST